ncbi:MAG: MBL fold metallo-hydrolase [Bdellovibrionota bacterium]
MVIRIIITYIFAGFLPLPALVMAATTSNSAIYARTAEFNFCSGIRFAVRTGKPSCWARFPASGNELCLSRDLWISMLKDQKTPCGKWIGRWRVVPFLDNDINHHGTHKQVRQRFIAKQFIPKKNETADFVWKFPAYFMNRVESIREMISANLSPHDALGVCRKLIINESARSDASEIIRRLGFVHVLTATGIHLYALASWLDRAIQAIFIFLGLSARHGLVMRRICVALAWSSAWILSGARPGMLRPLLVVSMRSMAKLAGFRWRRWSPLSTAILIDLSIGGFLHIINPNSNSIWSPGRMAYALAVGGGLLVVDSRAHGIRTHFAMAVSSWVFLAIVDAWVDNTVALATPLLSIITIPLFCLVIYPSALFTLLLHLLKFTEFSTFTSSLIADAATFIISKAWLMTASFETLWLVPKWALLAGVFFATLYMLARHMFVRRWFHAVFLFFIITSFLAGIRAVTTINATNSQHAEKQHYAMQVEQLDVGQGDAALVIMPDGRAGLVDAGPGSALSYDRWLRIMSQRNLTSLDWVFLTHSDEDHSGGLTNLSSLMPIGCVDAPSANNKSSCVPFDSLAVWQNSSRNSSGNSLMKAILIPLANGGYYISAGDASKKQEIALTHWLKGQLPKIRKGPRILKISHHGSKHSTASGFLDLLMPSTAWISAGLTNHYGHPSLIVLKNLDKKRIMIRRTDHDGILSTNNED